MQTRLLIIDAQGGGIGKQLITDIKKTCSGLYITAAGTNAVATSNMLKAGADTGATGENAIVVSCRKNDIILGPIGIAIADSMHGEITPAMALAVAQSDAKRILIPFSNCDNFIVGTSGHATGYFVSEAVNTLKTLL